MSEEKQEVMHITLKEAITIDFININYEDKVDRLRELGLVEKAVHLQLDRPVVICAESNEY